MFNDNKDFFPTPKNVIDIMTEGEILTDKIFLEKTHKVMKMFKISIIVIAAVLSCTRQEQDVCSYQGNQIVEKAKAADGKWFRFRKDGKITERIYVVEYDWNKYSVGDTLYCQ